MEKLQRNWLVRLRKFARSDKHGTDLPLKLPDMMNREDHYMIVERRLFLMTPALYGLTFFAKSDFEEFTRQAGEYAKRMIADSNRNEDEYLFRVASLAAALNEFPAVEFGAPFKTMRSGMSYRGSGIAVIQWRMEPNSVYPAHNHPGYNGITVGIRGECRMRNFDFVGTAPDMKSRETFLVKETQDNILRPGTVCSMMSTKRDNIHQLEAGNEVVIGADIIAKVGPDQGFSFVTIEDQARNPKDRTYEATWKELG